LFPAKPTEPRQAIAINILKFYQALFEKSNDAINAFAGALRLVYIYRGFAAVHSKVWEISLAGLIDLPITVYGRVTPSLTHTGALLLQQSLGLTTCNSK